MVGKIKGENEIKSAEKVRVGVHGRDIWFRFFSMTFLRQRRILFVTRDKLLAGNVGKTIARVSPRSVRYIVEYTRLLFQTLLCPLSSPLFLCIVWVHTQIASRDGRRYRLLQRASGTAQRWTLWKWSTLFFRHPATATTAANRKQYGHRRHILDVGPMYILTMY